jgi:hypothetical protein
MLVKNRAEMLLFQLSIIEFHEKTRIDSRREEIIQVSKTLVINFHSLYWNL